jgi:hypothetical protein
VTVPVVVSSRVSDLPVDTNSEDRVLVVEDWPFYVIDFGKTVLNDKTPKRGRGRPRTITDMKVYKAMKQREYRARKK